MASYYALLLSAAGLASSAALASTALSCPASNGTTVSNSTAGTTYTIECGIDRYDNDLGLVYKPTLETCIDACNDNPKCVDVSWVSLLRTYELRRRPLKWIARFRATLDRAT